MTREEAIEKLYQCEGCGRWITAPSCDSCWVSNHRCPPAATHAIATLREAVRIGDEAKRVMEQLRKGLG